MSEQVGLALRLGGAMRSGFRVLWMLVSVALALAIIEGIAILSFVATGVPPLSREATVGPFVPEFQGSASGLEVWKWTDGKVECIIAKSGVGIDSVCHTLTKPESTPWPKEPLGG